MLAGLVLVALVAAACGKSDAASKSSGPVTLRLGYFPNITHAPAIVGLEKGLFAKALSSNVTVQASTFNAGPAAVEAIFAGALDATYVGPNPAINAFSKSNGSAVRIVAGAASGGASLVVKPSITSVADLKGKKVASPQLGNTQDVALRSWLKSQGLSTTTSGGGDVSVVPQDNAQTLDTFKSGQIDGAWVPEPWATRLVQEGGGKVLVDEKSLWPGGKFVTTVLLVRTAFMRKHPEVIAELVKGHVDAVNYIAAHPDDAQAIVNAGIKTVTSKALAPGVIAAAWNNLTFTVDPIASSLYKGADNAVALGLTSKVNLTALFDLAALNKVLKDAGKAAVSG
jgi:sulfonate transport system substrate-binding protein